MGIIVNPGEVGKIEKFLSEFPKYKLGNFPTSKCLTTFFPYVGFLSFVIAVFRVYPKLKESLKKNDFKKVEGVMEVYNLLRSSEKNYIQFMVPVEN